MSNRGLNRMLHPPREASLALKRRDKHSAFTLIELLIVIAIILILIAIALPNFLEAQIRAKLVRVNADLRTVTLAMETYFQDFRWYPPDHDPNLYDVDKNGLYQLTTPIAYLPEVPMDVFNTRSGVLGPNDEFEFEMGSTGLRPAITAFAGPPFGVHAYVITCHGPSQTDSFGKHGDWPFFSLSPCGAAEGWINYAPTNGSRSSGEIVVRGGEFRTGSYCIDHWMHVLGHPNR